MTNKKVEKVAEEQEHITLHKLIVANDPIWVRNMTHTLSGSNASGIIALPIQRPNGSEGKEFIQPGKTPVCLTDKYSAESLKHCDQLFQLIDDGALELLDPKNEKQYYAEIKERKRLEKAKKSRFKKINLPDDLKGNPREDMIKQMTLGERGEEVVAKKPKRVKVKHSTHPRVASLCERAKSSSGDVKITETAMLQDLVDQEDSFSKGDFEYLVANGVYDSVIDWAEEKLNKK